MKTRMTVSSLLFAVSLGYAAPSPTETAGNVSLCYPIADVSDILDLYASITHFKIVRDNYVQGKVSISVAEPVSPTKAIEIIEQTLFADGFTIVQVNADTFQVLGHGVNPRGNGVPVVTDPKELPAQERLVSYLFQLKYANAQKVSQLFLQYLMPIKTYTSCIATDNTVLVTERTSVIRQLLVLAERIDAPPTQQTQKSP
jgi:type II secretory pathway component GspD/PulD (secretin)